MTIQRLVTLGFIGLSFLSSRVHGQNLTQEIQKNLDIFEEVKFPNVADVQSLNMELGKTVLETNSGVYDGFRFTVPEGQDGKDFIWYFSAPPEYSNWYIVPGEGPYQPGFETFLVEQMLFQHEKGLDAKRIRLKQSLRSTYFEEGETYVIWFKRTKTGRGPSTDKVLSVVMAFRPPKGRWTRENINKALKLVPSPAEVQVRHLNSRGGMILLDETLFDPELAEQLIFRAVNLYSRNEAWQSTQYIGPNIIFESSKHRPSIKEILEKHGPPNFIQTAQETTRLRKDKSWMYRTGGKHEFMTYHYDMFGFQIDPKDPDQKVQRVFAHGLNTVPLQSPPDTGSVFVETSKLSLLQFFQDQKEVGRFYHFGHPMKQAFVPAQPPPDEYVADNKVFIYKGDGEGMFRFIHPNGEIAQEMQVQNYLFHGKAFGKYPDGTLRFETTFRDGLMHGEMKEYPQGAPPRILHFRNGRMVP